MSVPIKAMIGRNFTPADNLLVGQFTFDNFDALKKRIGVGDGNVSPLWYPSMDRQGNMYMQPSKLIKSESDGFGDHGFGFEGTDFVVKFQGQIIFRVNTLGGEFKGLLKNSGDVTQFMPSDVGLAELIAPLFNNKTLIAQFNRPAYAGIKGTEKRFVVSRSTNAFIQEFNSIFYRRGTADSGSVSTVNKYGAYQKVPQDEPRIQYDLRSKKCLGLMIEPAATNLLINSGSPDSWDSISQMNLTRLTPTNWAAKGLSNPLSFVETNTSAEHSFTETHSANQTLPLSLSFFYEALPFTGTRKATIFASDSTRSSLFGIDIQSSSLGAPIIVNNRTVGNGSVTKSSVEHVGSNIYRVKVTGVINSSATNVVGPVKTTFASLGDGGSTIVFTPTYTERWCYVNDFQVEQNPFVTSYILTGSIPLTRNAEVFQLNLDSNFSFTGIEGLLEVGLRINLETPVNTIVFTLQSESGADRIEFYVASKNDTDKTCVIGTRTFVNNAQTANNVSLNTGVLMRKGKIIFNYEDIGATFKRIVFSGATGLGAVISSITYE